MARHRQHPVRVHRRTVVLRSRHRQPGGPRGRLVRQRDSPQRIKLPDHGRPTLLFDPNEPIAVGGDPQYDLNPGNPNPENFDGTIGQVAVYQSVLTSGTISLHYEAGVSPGVTIAVKSALRVR